MPTIEINPGDNWTPILEAAPSNSDFLIKSGEHRLQNADNIPSGSTITGENGAIVNGAEIITNWTASSGKWYSTQSIDVIVRDNIPGFGSIQTYSGDRVGWNVNLIYDDAPLYHVATLNDVVSGTFWYDTNSQRLWIADDPGGVTVELSRLRNFMHRPNANITIDNLEIINFCPEIENYVIEGFGVQQVTVRNCTIRNATSGAIRVASNGTVEDCVIHDIGQIGVSASQSSNVLVQRNDFRRIGFQGGEEEYHNGGVKITSSSNVRMNYNYFEDIFSRMLWVDINVVGFEIIGNKGQRGTRELVFVEISYDGIVENNEGFDVCTAGRPGVTGAAITVGNSENIIVRGNKLIIPRVTDNGFSDWRRAIVGLQNKPRGTGIRGEWRCYNVLVELNIVVLLDGSGLAQIGGGYATHRASEFFNSWNNVFKDNIYRIESGTPANIDILQWASSGASNTGGPKNLSEAQSQSGQEIGSIIELATAQDLVFSGSAITPPPSFETGLDYVNYLASDRGDGIPINGGVQPDLLYYMDGSEVAGIKDKMGNFNPNPIGTLNYQQPGFDHRPHIYIPPGDNRIRLDQDAQGNSSTYFESNFRFNNFTNILYGRIPNLTALGVNPITAIRLRGSNWLYTIRYYTDTLSLNIRVGKDGFSPDVNLSIPITPETWFSVFFKRNVVEYFARVNAQTFGGFTNQTDTDTSLSQAFIGDDSNSGAGGGIALKYVGFWFGTYGQQSGVGIWEYLDQELWNVVTPSPIVFTSPVPTILSA